MTINDSSLKLKGMSPLLLVTDLNQSIAFYTRQLGFEVAFLYEDFYAGLPGMVIPFILNQGALTAKKRLKDVKMKTWS